MNLHNGKKGQLQVHKIKKAASNFWVQLPVAAVAAVALALLVTSYIGSGSQANASDFSADKSQRDALADGVVTQGEYTSAVNRTLACVRAAGGQVIQPRYEDYRNVPVMNFVISEPNSKPGSASTYDTCRMVYSINVEFAWGQQEASKVTPGKHAADAQTALACAAEEGLGVTTIDELRDLNRSAQRVNGDVGRCMTIAIDGYDIKEHPPIRVD